MNTATPATVSRLGLVYLQSEEEYAPLPSFKDSVISNLKALGSAEYVAHKRFKVNMALAMISAMHYGLASDETINFLQNVRFFANYLEYNMDGDNFMNIIQDYLVLNVPAHL